jgi:hypothetical protein
LLLFSLFLTCFSTTTSIASFESHRPGNGRYGGRA